jgi:predicted ATP-dependent endonuclease of OLD family
MRLYRLRIQGYRKLKDVTVQFGDATFCIGPNNSGKSSVLTAIERLLSADKRISESEYYSERDPETGETKSVVDRVVLEAEFRNVPLEAKGWRGFKGRTFDYEIPDGSGETGVCIHYRKTFCLGKDVAVELKSKVRTIKEAYGKCSTPQQLIDAGIKAELVDDIFKTRDKNISEKDKVNYESIDEMWDVGEEEVWFQNPGGIPGNVLNRLPKYLRIPADASVHEIEDPKRGVLGKTLNALFEEVRDASDNYRQAQALLNKLAEELDPSNSDSEFGKMMADLNRVLSGVFPDSELHATADLSDPNRVLVPNFSVQMSSNVKTAVSHQGTGMIRSAVFGMLRFHQKWVATRENQVDRSLIIGFEEPEIYLHPSAANQMRDTIYELSSAQSQIVATTHSPYMIDLSRKPRQVLNRLRSDAAGTVSNAFSVTDEFIRLSEKDKSYVKMILKMDDYVARAFFTKRVIIVEGDTEDIAIREAIARLPDDRRLRVRSDFEVIKARGKASIIGLANYLKALGVEFTVIHDRDGGVEGAEKFNAPIAAAVGDADRVIVLNECLEDVLGYDAPLSEKPLRAYETTQSWGKNWGDVPQQFRDVLRRAFGAGYLE